ncbi:MAG TPA: hypothetical protein VH186_36050 [Chloroflexia bacterium]|nr:hypothetical protein [Chloroflexia bacterium]
MQEKLEHTVPTHIDVRDKSFFGLDFQQFMWLFIGLSCTALIYNIALAGMPVIIRLALSALITGIILALVLIRPDDHSLADWLFDRLYFYYSPQSALFRLQEIYLDDTEDEEI